MKAISSLLAIISFILCANLGHAQYVLFSPPIKFQTLRNPLNICVADFDYNGRSDIAVTSQIDSAVAVYFGNGNGTFENPQIYPISGSPTAILASDLDWDGKCDLAVTCGDSNIAILENTGYHCFHYARYYSCGNSPVGLCAANITLNSVADLVVCNFSDDKISILSGDSNEFRYSMLTQYDVVDGPAAVIAGRFGGYWDRDIAIANFNSNNIALLIYDYDNLYENPRYYAVGNEPRDIISIDYDYDQDWDIFTVNSGSNNLSILNCDDSLNYIAEEPIPLGDYPTNIFAADLDNDGPVDFVVTNFESDNVSVLINQFGDFAPQVVYDAGHGPFDIAAADFDGDGDIDLAVTNNLTDSISILFNRLDYYILYTSGDINGDRESNGLDITYGINYFKGFGPPPNELDCGEYGTIFAGADFNGNCVFNGVDIVYAVNFFKGSWIWPTYCIDCPPHRRNGGRGFMESGCVGEPLVLTDSSYMYAEVRGNDINITHMWGGFNCNFEYFVDFQFSGQNITGFEHNIAWPPFACGCLFHARSSLYDMDPGTYIITLISENIQDTVGIDTAVVIGSFR